MANTEYQACMTKAMQGFPKGISRQERGDLFCVSAKLCSGKARNESEAKQLCANRAPSPSKKGRGRKGIDSEGIARCLLPMLTDGQTVSIKELSAWISECSGKSGGVKIKKPETKNHFLKNCAMEMIIDQGLKGTFAESIRMRKLCEAKWKEKEAGTDVQTG